MTKDYSLLRPFDLEKAKAGEAIICDLRQGSNYKLAAGPDMNGKICVITPEDTLVMRYQNDFQMAPLAWVEGKPVYRGDVLYGKSSDMQYTIADVTDGRIFSFGNSSIFLDESCLTWTPPKKTREVKLLGWLDSNNRVALGTFDCVQGMNWKRIPELDRTVTVEE